MYTNTSDILFKFGLHAYDSQGRHTGMKPDCADFELGIPDSYYTGDYGGGSYTPQVIVGYSDDVNMKNISKFRLFAPKCLNPSLSRAALAPQTSKNTHLNWSIEDQTGISTTEIKFYDINVTESTVATIDVSDPRYILDLDMDGDNITDQTISPDLIYITPAIPQNNIQNSIQRCNQCYPEFRELFKCIYNEPNFPVRKTLCRIPIRYP
jgi:hypothetical protein